MSRTFIHSHPCSNAFETSRVQLTPLRLCAIPSRRYSPRIVHSSIRLARGGLVAAVLLLAMAAPAAGIQSSGKLGAVDTCPVANQTAPTQTVYLPNITKTLGGPTGWVTPFIVQNTGTIGTTLEVSFYKFSDGSCVARRTVSLLAPGTSFADVPNNDSDLPGDAQFSVVVKSFGSTIVSVVNEQAGTGARAEALSYNGISSGATTVSLPRSEEHTSELQSLRH